MQIATPYLMFLGDVPDTLAAKTAYGIKDWRPEWCVGQMRLPSCAADLGIPDMTLPEALAKGCRTLVIGVVNAGGVLPDHWVKEIVAAIEAGLDVASGLHVKLGAVPAIAEAAARRELYEETNVPPEAVKLLAEIPGWLPYDLPPAVMKQAWKGRYRGQTQKWFAYGFVGSEDLIDVLRPGGGAHKAEFDAWRWARFSELPDLIVPFKRPVYERVVAAFAGLDRWAARS